MRKSAMLTAVTMLLGGCSVLTAPPAEVRPEPVPAQIQPPASEAKPEQAAQPPARPRRPQAVRIDNTSIASFRASWERMRASLSRPQQTDLHDAVARLTFATYGGADDLPGNLRVSPIVPEMIRDRLGGLTYAEIIALSP
jgi:hypothetical protein